MIELFVTLIAIATFQQFGVMMANYFKGDTFGVSIGAIGVLTMGMILWVLTEKRK